MTLNSGLSTLESSFFSICSSTRRFFSREAAPQYKA
jgi:hypothetical protein